MPSCLRWSCPLLAFALFACVAAHATPILQITSPTSTTPRGADSGVGQEITVSANTTLTGIGLDAILTSGADLDFFIFDVTDSTLLYSQVDTFSPSSSLTWVETSTPFSFNLTAGSSYYIGVTTDATASFGTVAGANYTANGITVVNSANSSYYGFTSPQAINYNVANTDVALELDGNPTPTPEPGTLALMATGLVSLPLFLTAAPSLAERFRRHRS